MTLLFPNSFQLTGSESELFLCFWLGVPNPVAEQWQGFSAVPDPARSEAERASPRRPTRLGRLHVLSCNLPHLGDQIVSLHLPCCSHIQLPSAGNTEAFHFPVFVCSWLIRVKQRSWREEGEREEDVQLLLLQFEEYLRKGSGVILMSFVYFFPFPD